MKSHSFQMHKLVIGVGTSHGKRVNIDGLICIISYITYMTLWKDMIVCMMYDSVIEL